MATYNRSNIVGYSIATVLNQTFQNWELIVVGDYCTDDTEKVVRGFNDPRIHFFNLPTNFGEQSGPNNEGLKKARGTYLAFLNQDDLWFNNHLETLLERLKANDADLVFAAGIVDHGNERYDVVGLFPQTGYHPDYNFVPASNWLFKKELLDEIGYWRPAREIYLIPSHDWQTRVYHAGKKISTTTQLTVLALPSSSRKKAYSERSFTENKFYFEQLSSPNFRTQLLTGIIFQFGQVYYHDENIYLVRFFKRKIKKLLTALGFNTTLHIYRFRFGKGGVLKKYRHVRGLDN
jgi:glycosyltransferase involved in cell wall biosynthesis